VHFENVNKKDLENWDNDLFKKDNYIYANYLPSGQHKFLIYCPISKRAFIKTMFVGTNTKDHYPEWPIAYEKPRKKLILNVWRNCQKITQDLK